MTDITETDLIDVFTRKEYLALSQLVTAMLLKGELENPGYVEEIRGIVNMARISVEVDVTTWSLLDHFASDIRKLTS